MSDKKCTPHALREDAHHAERDGYTNTCQHGSLGKAAALFGDKLKPLIAELNERLAA